MILQKIKFAAACLAMFFLTANVWAQTSVFLYQGRLNDNNNPANATYEMQFKLFDALAGGNQIGATQTSAGVSVTNGIFSVSLDFGANTFTGANRFLEISVRRNAGEQFVVLAPRTQILTAPYSIRSNSAALADNSNQLGGIPATEYVTNSTVGSSFIRNQTAQQTANFNISGNGFFGGSVGIGTTNPQSPLAVQTAGGIGYGFTQTSGTVTVGSFIDVTGGWFGTRSNHPLHFFTNDSSQQMTLTTNGRFGIGTTNPGSGFELSGTGFGAQQRITDSTSGNSLVLQTGTGNSMKVTGYNYVSSTAVPLYLSVDGANTNVGGNLTQTRTAGGSVKAMVFVNGINGSIVRCYNGISGVSIPTCGISAERITTGFYRLSFPFQINDRFFSLSTFGFGVVVGVNDTIIGQTGTFPTPTSVNIHISETTSGGSRDGDFCFIVY